MKFAKLSIFALAMGLFVASCGNSETKTEEGTTTDTTATMTTTVDTAAVAPATVDTAAQAAPAADTTVKTEVKTEETKTEVKH